MESTTVEADTKAETSTNTQATIKTKDNKKEKTRTLLGLPEFIVGLAQACFTSWVSMNFHSVGIYASASVPENVLDTVYLVSIIAVCLTLLFAGIYQKATAKILQSAVALWILPLCISLATLIAPLAGYLNPGISKICIYASGIVSGVTSGVYLIHFGMAFSRLRTRSCVIAAASGTVFSAFIFSVSLLFGSLEASVFAASMPLVAAALLQMGMHLLEEAGAAEPEHPYQVVNLLGNNKDSNNDSNNDNNTKKAQKNAAEISAEKTNNSHAKKGNNGEKSQSSISKHWKLYITKFVVASVLIGFANETARTLYVQMGIVGRGGPWYSAVSSVAAAIATIVAVGIALALINRREEHMARNCYHTLILMLAVSMLLLPLPLAYGEAATLIAQAINTASYACFSMLIWIIITGICSQDERLRISTFALVRAGWAFGPLLGIVLGRWVRFNVGITLASVVPIMSICTVAILVTSSFVFTETDLVHTMDFLPTQHRRRFHEKCQKVASTYKLSGREIEVMMLLAKGRNLPYVQEQLLLSKGTASTHRQHIYQKLDIHSQQELIELVQQTDI